MLEEHRVQNGRDIGLTAKIMTKKWPRQSVKFSIDQLMSCSTSTWLKQHSP